MSQKKTDSNRINARKSTGPKTLAGKAIVCVNAIKLGMYTKDIVLPNEDVNQYSDLLASLRDEHQPQTATEFILVESMGVAIWRRRRLHATEVGFYDHRICELTEAVQKRYDVITPNAEMAHAVRDDYAGPRMLSDLWRHDTRLERSFHRSLKELQRLQAERPNRPDTSGGPHEQKSQEQSQMETTTAEHTTSEPEPTPKSVRKSTESATENPYRRPEVKCSHKHLLSGISIAFGGQLS